MRINLLDLFSGIGGFAQGLKQAGFEIENHYFSEIEKHPIAIYKNQFPEANYVGSVTDIRGADLPRINAITFGSPCQDFSLAGKRAGLEGERSGLLRQAIRLIDECRPDFFVWENVKGVFSSNDGADFWAVIQAFTDIGGYRLEWQLLNTAWFLPQNRERVYLVGSIGEGGERAVFPIRESHKDNEQARQQPSDGLLVNCIDANYSKGPDGKRTMIKVAQINSSQDGQIFSPSGISQCLSAGHGNAPKVMVPAQQGRNPENPSDRRTEQRLEINTQGTTNTLTSVAKDNYVVERIGGWRENENTISAYRDDKHRTGVSEHVYHKPEGIATTLQTAQVHKVITPGSIRRLTEIECERLQGFADNWTAFGNYDSEIKKVPATGRYKALGNAVTVNVVQAVGESILEAI